MKLDKNALKLYIITDRTWLVGSNLSVQVEEAIKAGATFVQLREKNIDYEEFLKIAMDIKTITDKYNIPLVINDNVDVAIAVDADGVHIGQSDEELLSVRKRLGKDKIIGVSTQTIDESLMAQKNGADYLGVGAVFTTSTKLDANYVSKNKLREICDIVDIPVVAIGGITADNVKELKNTGIDGVSVISAVFAQPDIYNATVKLRKNVEEMMTT